MDLGFGSLVEKFEEHFGRWPTKFMLAMVGLTALTFCVRTLINDAIYPVIEYVRGIDSSSSLKLIASVSTGALASGLFAFIGGLVLRLIFTRKADQIIARAQKNMNEAREIAADARNQISEMKTLLAEISDRRDEPEGSQPHQDTNTDC